MQRGTIFKKNGSWTLKYFDVRIINGERTRKPVCKVLARVQKGEKKPPFTVRLEADKLLEPINTKRLQPESAMTVVEFADKYFIPYLREHKKPSTVKFYEKDCYELHIKKRLEDLSLRDFRTVHGQRILRIPNLAHQTLLRLKSFLSALFKHAKREGFIDGLNPMVDVQVEGKSSKAKGEHYTLGETEVLLGWMPEPVRTVVALAALTGLRQSEIRGLQWQDFDGETLHVQRSVWRTHVTGTKNPASEAYVPVLPLLQKALVDHKARCKRLGPHDFIFAGEKRGTPLNLANVARRIIVPTIDEKKSKAEGRLDWITWKGWHAWRRGLASNLYQAGVKPAVIQSILRHSDIGTTMSAYVQTPTDEARNAVAKIEEYFGGTL
jgi:integrase